MQDQMIYLIYLLHYILILDIANISFQQMQHNQKYYITDVTNNRT